jgi:ABC-type sugar transport system permease subunit
MSAVLTPAFLADFAAGLLVNLHIAVVALGLGLVGGLALAALLTAGPALRRVGETLLWPLRAAPTFVVMFVLLNLLPPELGFGSLRTAMSPWWAVVLSQCAYTTAFAADVLADAWRQRRRGSNLGLALLPTALLRAFFVVTLSSGFGAAIGVVESTAVTMRAIEALPTLSHRLLLLDSVMVFYTVCLQILYAAAVWGRDRLVQRVRAGETPSPRNG